MALDPQRAAALQAIRDAKAALLALGPTPYQAQALRDLKAKEADLAFADGLPHPADRAAARSMARANLAGARETLRDANREAEADGLPTTRDLKEAGCLPEVA